MFKKKKTFISELGGSVRKSDRIDRKMNMLLVLIFPLDLLTKSKEWNNANLVLQTLAVANE